MAAADKDSGRNTPQKDLVMQLSQTQQKSAGKGKDEKQKQNKTKPLLPD